METVLLATISVVLAVTVTVIGTSVIVYLWSNRNER